MNVQQYKKCIRNQFSSFEICKLDNLHTEAMMFPLWINTYVVVVDTEEDKGITTDFKVALHHNPFSG